ncbi:hypothetical protein THAOC_33811 [Thalassiosira oceanica]|uniref:Uncharacterized protein n=1 Tax=Thalassiosira oceanica TaxID=159749 RepID=K0R3J1_THAOC|nr:hypothetical protein THAOC_33811 [Thalassiosira oceanica]|eukprot:EJK47463.1 hypothetical protein THAOC_33811 [Thalassiosira oceanica]
MLPTSTATLDLRPRPSDIVDVSMGSAGGPVASSLSATSTSFAYRTAITAIIKDRRVIGDVDRISRLSTVVGPRRAPETAQVDAPPLPPPLCLSSGEEERDRVRFYSTTK